MIIPNWRNKLKEYRKKKGISQSEMAVSIKVSQQTIVNWEKENGTNPSIDQLYLITKFLCISADELFNPQSKYSINEDQVSLVLEDDIGNLTSDVKLDLILKKVTIIENFIMKDLK